MRSKSKIVKPTEQLKEEHETIKLMLKILEKICEKINSGEDVDTEHLEKIVEFIKIFADKCHHGKEESLLFPTIEEEGIPRDGGPTGVMIMEHDAGRGYVKEMANAIDEYKNGNRDALKKFAENARNYVSLLTPHIEKENDILYMIADMHIPEDKQKELSGKFEEVEKNVIGPGKHEGFHKLLEHLEEIYLK